METNTPTNTYFAIRMATGNKVHLKHSGSSETLCAVWVHNSSQYKTQETAITCTKCWKRANAMTDRAAQVASLGFTKEVK